MKKKHSTHTLIKLLYYIITILLLKYNRSMQFIYVIIIYYYNITMKKQTFDTLIEDSWRPDDAKCEKKMPNDSTVTAVSEILSENTERSPNKRELDRI